MNNEKLHLILVGIIVLLICAMTAMSIYYHIGWMNLTREITITLPQQPGWNI